MAAHDQVDFNVDYNSRNVTEISVDGRHLSIPELKRQIQESSTINNRLPVRSRSKYYSGKPKIMDYLDKDIPSYPNPVEFQVSNVAHVTTEKIFPKILAEGFRPPTTPFSWWDLKITEEEINLAEKQYLEKNRLNEAVDSTERQESFLKKFTTSPLFTETSRYGCHRFTFPLAELMQLYKEQRCGGEEPVLRVFKTICYKQEIVYAVLVHSPEHNERFGKLPLLQESEFVHYHDGKMIWKAQAISETHRYELLSEGLKSLKSKIFYVWDQVSVVFHLPQEVPSGIKISEERLMQAHKKCAIDKDVNLSQYNTTIKREVLLKRFKREVEETDDVNYSGKKIKLESDMKTD